MLVILTILFWGFSIALSRFVLIAISEGQIFDYLFGWQKMLNKMYGSTNKAVNMLGKFLGECDVCLMHHTSIWAFFMYYAICKLVGNVWITDGITVLWQQCLVNLIWYLVFVFIAWYLSLKLNSK